MQACRQNRAAGLHSRSHLSLTQLRQREEDKQNCGRRTHGSRVLGLIDGKFRTPTPWSRRCGGKQSKLRKTKAPRAQNSSGIKGNGTSASSPTRNAGWKIVCVRGSARRVSHKRFWSVKSHFLVHLSLVAPDVTGVTEPDVEAGPVMLVNANLTIEGERCVLVPYR